ncbi:hypothetical protein [Streptomyces scabiei]|uniref:hypothetical protein n=1 Tax=Streptomyces scabiei TaxID=1930 RepID=UPI003A90A6E9
MYRRPGSGAQTGEAFGGEVLLARSVRVEEPPHDHGPAVACGDGRVHAVGEAHRRIVDLAGLGFQRGKEVVLRAVERGLSLDEKAVPLDDVGGVRMRGRRGGDRGLQLVHVHGEARFDPFGEHAHDILSVIGYAVGQKGNSCSGRADAWGNMRGGRARSLDCLGHGLNVCQSRHMRVSR